MPSEMGFDQHPKHPCVFLLREPSSRWNELHDDVLVIPSGDVGLVLKEVCMESWESTFTAKSMVAEACTVRTR